MAKQAEINSNKVSTTCAGAAAQTVALQDCADVGTAGWNTTGTDLDFAVTVAGTVPTVAESCAGAAGYSAAGTWTRLNPDAGVTTLDFQFQSGSASAGNHSIWIQMFQGTGCGALTNLGCQELLFFQMGALYVLNVHQEGVNPSQDVWCYVWDDSGKGFDVNFEGIGSGAPPSNSDCAGASTDDYGCNLGAGPESWTGPNNNGKTCTGGTWYSNENTVYFSFTASATTGTINVSGINCNEGTTGQAQFGVWNNCGCVGTYTAGCFRSCAVGSGTLSLAAMTPGTTYIIAVDGQAGDICEWNFSTTGIIIPIKLLSFTASATSMGNLISWTTETERDCAYFKIQRSEDGEHFYDIAKINGNGTKTTPTDYSFLDENHPSGLNYYRLIQVDVNGEEQYYAPATVLNDVRGIKVVPNPVDDQATISFGSNFEGLSEITVLDVSGKVVYRANLSTSKGTNAFELNTTSMSEGLYVLQVSNTTERMSIKFTK